MNDDEVVAKSFSELRKLMTTDRLSEADTKRLDEMYCIQEALDIGFEKYLIKKAKNIRQALEYHKENCPIFEGKSRNECGVCKITDKMVVELL